MRCPALRRGRSTTRHPDGCSDRRSNLAGPTCRETAPGFRRAAARSAPVVDGFYIGDLNALELGRWERKGGSGAFVNLEGTGGVNDMHVVEIAPGSASAPERHIYEAMIYVLSGRGSTQVWYDENRKAS